MIPHRAIVNPTWTGCSRPSRFRRRVASVLQKTPASFDASVWEIWLPLTAQGAPRDGAVRRASAIRAELVELAVIEHGDR